MKFDIEKKGYNRDQVDEFVLSMKNEYENKLEEQKNRIFSLKRTLVDTEKRLLEYEQKSNAISSALINANERADKIEKLAVTRYRNEIASLKSFREKWQAYYQKLLEKYPCDAELKNQREFEKTMDEILLGGRTEIEKIERRFDRERNRLLQKNESALITKDEEIDDFFCLDALYQRDDLATIMKDLGLMTESN